MAADVSIMKSPLEVILTVLEAMFIKYEPTSNTHSGELEAA